MPTYPAMGNNLKKLREASPWTIEVVAEKMAYSKGGYLKLERSERKLSTKIIERAAKVFGVSQSEVYSEEVPVVGYVGAGSEAHYYDMADPTDEFVPMPPGGTEKTVAVEVRGTSLGSLFDKWLVYYDDIHDPPTANMMRQLCVVALEDDRVLVKQLMKGSAPGLYNLASQTEGIIEDVPIRWAALVKAMTPR